MWEDASHDALMHAPVPMGDHRVRRLDRQLLAAVCDAAGERTLGRIGGQVAHFMARARGWSIKEVSKTVANNTGIQRVLQYSAACRKAMADPEVRIVSIAFDGTRMSKRDTLYAVCQQLSFKLRVRRTCMD